VVLAMQRVHEDDLAGHLLEKGGWSQLRLPAIAAEAEEITLEPQQLTAAQLEEVRRHLGSHLFEARYQQDPIPAGGTLIKAEWLVGYTGVPDTAGGFAEVVQSWDVASKAGGHNDWSICTTWGIRDGTYWLLDVRRCARAGRGCELGHHAHPGTAIAGGAAVVPIRPKLDKSAR
jgi:hypothetical protein